MKSKIIVICMILLVLCSVAVVSAQDNLNEMQITQDEANDIPLANEIENDTSTYSQQTSSGELQAIPDEVTEVENDTLKYSQQGSFDELQVSKDESDLLGDDYNDLINAISNAPENSIIYLDKDYNTPSKDYGAIIIDKSLTIDGQGHTIDRQLNGQLFKSKKGDIILKNLIIKNSGEAVWKGDRRDFQAYGGAVFMEGSAKYTIINCTFIGCAALNGGAIANNVPYDDKRSYTSLEVINCTFDGNNIESSGGAIYSKGKAYIENSRFVRYQSDYDNSAIYASAPLHVTSSVFDSNSACSSNPFSTRRYSGAAIYATKELICEYCNFTNNRADYGGAISTFDFALLGNNLFKNNYVGTDGGAICNSGRNKLVIDNSTFIGNNANSGKGGAIYSSSELIVMRSNFINNTAGDKGGAIWSNYIQFDGRVSFIGNSAGLHGGAIYVDKISKDVYDLYFESNTAKGESLLGNDGAGAIFINKKCGDIYFHNSTFIGNKALAADGGAIISFDSETTLNIYNCTFIDNSATGGTAKRCGGAIMAAGKINIFDSTFKNNHADTQGGAIHTGKLGTVDNSVFISNYAKYGGALYTSFEINSVVTRSYFDTNYANNRGGAIYTNKASTSSFLTLENNTFINNDAGGEGKAVFNSGVYVSIKGNWWGTNSPSFGEDLVEYKAFPRSNVIHKDSDVNKVSISGDSNAYNFANATIKITFEKEVPTYLLQHIITTSNKEGDFSVKSMTKNTVELTYLPKEGGNHLITAKINSQTLIHDLTSRFISVYGYDVVKVQGDPQTYFAIFKDENGEYLNPGEEVIFKLQDDDMNYTHTVSDDGMASFDEILNLRPGTYQVIAFNPITKESFINTVTIKLITLEYNINDTFMVEFVGADSVNGNVTFKIGEKTFVSNITNSTASFRLDVPAATYVIDIYYMGELIDSIVNVNVLNQYSESIFKLDGSNYAALVPVRTNENFTLINNNSAYSELGENMRRYVTDYYTGEIVYNVTVSNSAEFTDVLRKINEKDFYVDVVIINLKPGTYRITEGFYKDQEWKYLIHRTTGYLFINGNGAILDDDYTMGFATVESSACVSIENVTFKKFKRVFVNNGNVYCANCNFIENDATGWIARTPGSVIYNKKEATFKNCLFSYNKNDDKYTTHLDYTSSYKSKLLAAIYADASSVTNFVTCKFDSQRFDSIHAVDKSMVVLYDDDKSNYNRFTTGFYSVFEEGSCLDYRPTSSFNVNKTSTYTYNDLTRFITELNNEFHKDNSSAFVINLEKQDYTLNCDQCKQISSPYDFRTYNREFTFFSWAGEKDSNLIHQRYLLEVGSRPIVVNGNGASITLTDNSYLGVNEYRFAFIPAYSTLTLINLTISGFNTAIVNYGQLILINCTLNNNKIHNVLVDRENEFGGAIRNYANAFCYNTTFSNNRATEGAAYYSKGSCTVGLFYNCTFVQNTIISNIAWKNKATNNLYVCENSVAKIINCTGIDQGNIKVANGGLISYRNTLNLTYCNYKVEDVYSLMKLAYLVKTNKEYDVINVTFVPGDYGVLPSTLFEMDFGQLILFGNGARIFNKFPSDKDEAHFLVTTSRSSVIINGLTVEGFNIAIINNGDMYIINSTFNNNRVDYKVKNDYGGAIVNNLGATLLVYNSTFTNNYAKYGGAIYNKGTANVIDCNFTNNKGYSESSLNVDIYNQQSATGVVIVGNLPTVIDHFPIAAWLQDVIHTGIYLGIMVGTSLITGFFAPTLGPLVNKIVNAAIGAAGGIVEAFIYSNSYQDYSSFKDKVIQGAVFGLKSTNLAKALMNYAFLDKFEPPEDSDLHPSNPNEEPKYYKWGAMFLLGKVGSALPSVAKRSYNAYLYSKSG